MKAILVNYCYDPTWLDEYRQLDVMIYDRSDDKVDRNLQRYGKVYKTNNMGDVDFDKLGYLVNYYDELPEVFLWSKSNIFKYVDKDFLDQALEKKEFTPLLRFDHKIYADQFGQVNNYQGNIYLERADSWFFNVTTQKYFRTWDQWCMEFGIPRDKYIPFAPGGSYILTRERVHRYSRDFYKKMQSALDHAQRPAEAHAAERSYYYLWK